MGKRLVYIDQLKGLAILLVVIGHVLQFCIEDSEASWLYKSIVTFHMPLFAFLSGLMFSAKYDVVEMAKKLSAQSQKLLLPFFSFGIIYAFTIRWGEQFLQHPFKLGLWYLLFLWQCYLITHSYNVVIYRLGIQGNHKLSVMVDIVWLAFAFLMFKLLYEHLASEGKDILGIIHLYKLYPFFFVGYVIKRYQWFEAWFSSERRIFADVSFVVWIVLFLVSLFCYSSFSLMMILGAFAVYPIVMLFYLNGGVNSQWKRILEMFGRYSLEIYILHRFFTSTCDLEILGKYIKATGSWTIELFAALALSLLFSYACVFSAKILRKNRIFSIILLGDKIK